MGFVCFPIWVWGSVLAAFLAAGAPLLKQSSTEKLSAVYGNGDKVISEKSASNELGFLLVDFLFEIFVYLVTKSPTSKTVLMKFDTLIKLLSFFWREGEEEWGVGDGRTKRG